MKVMVVGGGGREHAIIKKLKENKTITKIYALPGNGGISADAECIDIKTTDILNIKKFAKEHNIDFAVVASDDPLVLGAVDELNSIGIKCFGPDKKAAIIEGSKAFSKELMKKYNIPTAEYQAFSNIDKAKEYVKSDIIYPLYIKTDGLALGKGAVFAPNSDEACRIIDDMMLNKVFGESGNTIIIEECMEGPEVTVLAFTDGKTIVPMVSSMDHKRALDNDEGLNTGGMGTIAPSPFYTPDIAAYCMENIYIPTINAMNAEGRPFKGCLYIGLMLTKNGPKVIEYNCRFGDPETQVVLPLLKTDLFTIMQHIADEKLADINIEFLNKAACCVIAASNGYPSKYEKGFPIKISENHNIELYHAGTAIKNGSLITNGGRVIGITAVDDTLEKAIKKAYSNIESVSFDNMYFRKDIGKKVLCRED
ncbi:phosphoribosylamine--glycine ligase [Eubacteriales bacterium OttesenSCG-928-G02]|nr:phosphoribosylamine--glycine ligase [Eubacteriales bacterium OttesenSCG-928-G02]